MRKLILIILLGIITSPGHGQHRAWLNSELQQILFIHEVNGMTAMMRNPAGLSTRDDDDGVFFNYSFLTPSEQGEINFSLAMKNLAFAIQENFFNEAENENSILRTYGLGLSVGGRILSIGTKNKIIELQLPDQQFRVFSVDAGIVFQPTAFLTVAAFAKDLDEPQLGAFELKREYSTGLGLRFLERRLKIMAEASWNDHTRLIEDALVRVGIAIMPISNLEIRFGGSQDLFFSEQYFAMIQVPFIGGIRLLATARMNEQKQFLRYSTSILVPLKTVAF